MKNIEKIIHEFGKLQEDVSKRIITHYPSLKFPESLLPHKKEVIAAAIDEAIKIKENSNEIVNLLKVSRVFLDGFIDDREAYKSNDKLLCQDGYWEAIRENRNSLKSNC